MPTTIGFATVASQPPRETALSDVKLFSVWYIRFGDGALGGVFATSGEANKRADELTGERYVRCGWLASVDGVGGYLASDPQYLTIDKSA